MAYQYLLLQAQASLTPWANDREGLAIQIRIVSISGRIPRPSRLQSGVGLKETEGVLKPACGYVMDGNHHDELRLFRSLVNG